MSQGVVEIEPQSEGLSSGRLAKVDAWLEYLSDWVNPILVKEIRQALKSNQFALWFLLLLGGCWVTTIIGLYYLGPSAYYAAAGSDMYQWYAWMLAFPLVVVIPFTAFRSLAAEQEENTRDLLTVSALSPRQVINGKLGSACMQMVLYLSAIAPCLGFTYLLRGIDLLTVFLVPLIGVLASLGLSMFGVFLASLAQNKSIHILSTVVFIGLLFLVFGLSLSMVYEMVTQGFEWYQDDDWWTAMSALAMFYATTFLLLYSAAVACNTFTHANRSTPIRWAMLVQQSTFLGWCYVMWTRHPDDDYYKLLYVPLIYWTLAGMLLTSERAILSPRVRRALPTTGLARSLLTWLTPGPGTGYSFAVTNTLLCAVVALASVVFSGSGPRGMFSLDYIEIWAMTGFAVVYLGVGRLLIALLRRVSDLSLLGGFLIHLLTMLIGNTFPYAVRSFSRTFGSGFSFVDMVSAVAMYSHIDHNGLDDLEWTTFFFFLGAATFSVLLANAALAAVEVRQTRLPPPKRVIEDDIELNPAETPKPVNPWGDLPRDADPPG